MKTTDFPQRCKRCRYYARLQNDHICDYIGITGEMRGCPVGEGCDKYEPKKRAQRRELAQ